MDVKAVEQRPRHAVEIAPYLLLGAGAAALFVAEIAAGAGVHGGDHHDRARIGAVLTGARNSDSAVLNGLAQHLKSRARELGQLVEEQHAVVGERDLSGADSACAAASESDGRDCMVRRAERAHGNKSVVAQSARDGVYFGGLDHFLKRHVWQNGRNALCKHAFSRAGRAYKQDVVSACRGYFHSSLCLKLTFDLRKVGKEFS